MNDLVSNLIESLRGTSAGAKLVALVTGAACLAIVGLAAVVSSKPDYQIAFYDLSDHEVAKVCKALADAGISFQSSPGSPANVYVDEADRTAAFSAVYGAGALDKPLRGILTETGIASVFNSAEERRQFVRKREWQEMELMLQQLDFVLSAQVRTSPGDTSPIARNASPTTASVTLRTTGNLTTDQEDTIARIVGNGLGVEREDLVVSDHEGHTLFDGSRVQDDGEPGNEDFRAMEAEYDQRMTARANDVLLSILGPNMAHVTVTSEWNYEQSTTRSETPNGRGILLEESTNTSEKPVGGGEFTGGSAGGVAGLTSNVANTDPASGPAAAAPVASSSSRRGMEKTSQEQKSYRPALTTLEKVSVVPTLRRLSLALYVDESMDEAQVTALELAIQRSVGYDEQRDSFSRASLTFFQPEVPAQPEGTEPPAEPSAPSPMMETLLRRGVEILTALVFIVLLLKSLKGSKKAGAVVTPQAKDEIDPEMLARAHVDELLKSDPDRVGEILSSWARGEEMAGTRS
jgi:flagellar biosynthesis/type III secretory pathway M-ring protein FliF/YscJ